MKIDIVLFDDSEGVMSVYLDGEYYFNGDDYHNNIRDYIRGWLDGIWLIPSENHSIEVNRYNLTETGQIKFIDNGYNIPQVFPFTDYEYVNEQD